jgi:hypothetical protein
VLWWRLKVNQEAVVLGYCRSWSIRKGGTWDIKMKEIVGFRPQSCLNPGPLSLMPQVLGLVCGRLQWMVEMLVKQDREDRRKQRNG